MCGIYCFLKCNKCDENQEKLVYKSVFNNFKEYLQHRGPNGSSEYEINVGMKWLIRFAGSVLWMQGFKPTLQPLVLEGQSVLLWNGDIFNSSEILKSKKSGQDGNDVYTPTAYWYPLLSFLDSSTAADKSVSNFDSLVSETQNTDFEELLEMKQTHSSDTWQLSQAFLEAGKQFIPSFLTKIRGPYAFIYADMRNLLLYFGRDRLGRHSLLWSTDCEGGLVLTSVGKKNVLDLKEVPSLGVFMVDLNLPDIDFVTLFPWSDISSETLSLVEHEYTIKIKVSDHVIQSPLMSFSGNNQVSHISLCVMEQYKSEFLERNDEFRNLVEMLLLDSNIKTSIDKLILLLRNALQVRVETQPGICKMCLGESSTCDIHYSSEELVYRMPNAKLSQAPCIQSERKKDCSGTVSGPGVKIMCLDSTGASSTSEICQKQMNNSHFQQHCQHSKIGILFSGGLDSTVLAALANDYVPLNEPIDLLNVAFEKEQSVSRKVKKKILKEPPDEERNTFSVPDRITGRRALDELKKHYPHRQWNFVEINITQDELKRERKRIISDLIHPLNTVLDDSLGCALWFASRGKGCMKLEDGSDFPYSSPARVLLLGMGADELLGGYRRHRTALQLKGWTGLEQELKLDMARISTRNLGRDNRVVSDHGCQGRLPYLDESVVSYLSSLDPWERCYPIPAFPPGVGDKLLLRLVAWKLGLHYAAGLPKRAFQFGSRIANSKEKASDISDKL
ncbi:asparagine synthetase domain-containing protein CG17486 isoform X2 [Periplaneta americana]|uniref:asparagine synthetase domain-containing protein CG17486 isoform X2 n=1 Tax=Periplaneta americana TaxID=6978 RepID=UPI0037E94099